MIKYLFVDVDGTMTDGGIYYSENGDETKKFCTKDAAGFFAAKMAGIKIVVITGRECAATTRRMNELKVEELYQNIKDKYSFIKELIDKCGLSKDEIGYIGDDLNDLKPMELCGYIGCPADSCQEIKDIATYVSPVKGGYGAVRDCIEQLLRNEGSWTELVRKIYSGV